MKYSFVHISDLHYRPDWYEESELVCNKFFDDLADQVSKFQNLYLLFSGDVVLKGEKKEYYDCFLERFSPKFDKLGLTADRRILVPGNHDACQVTVKPNLVIQDGTLGAIKEERVFNDTLPQLSKSIFADKFKNYSSCESEFAKYTCCQDDLGGTGWHLDGGVGIYCLNSALCTFSGLEDLNGKKIIDKDRLHVDTRSLHRWLTETQYQKRVLVTHHPFEWLSDWAKNELEAITADNFNLVITGHMHTAKATFSSRGRGGSVFCAAPQLFSRKSDLLGYEIICLDVETGQVDVNYRQWTPSHRFVLGTSLANNDQGVLTFSPSDDLCREVEVITTSTSNKSTLQVLQAEYEEAITCYSSKKEIWVERDLASTPETATDRAEAVLVTPQEISKSLRNCIIRAPMQFGLTCVGRYLSFEYFKANSSLVLLMIDAEQIQSNKFGVRSAISSRCNDLYIDSKCIAGFILDNWKNDKHSCKIFHEIKEEYPLLPIILLHNLDDHSDVSNDFELDAISDFEVWYLWALSRNRIRELVVEYLKDSDSLDDNLVTKKLIEDIDALNIHRTPLNCLLILKLLEQAFDDTPVNRTEMIGRVLYLLFYQFNKIPRYATRPDLKDCEYALGYLSEWLIKLNKFAFTKNEFFQKVSEYCSSQIIDLDCEVLFSFLASENILVKKGIHFEFRFTYWLYFFAAHRMHHDQSFADYIFQDRRYTTYPEIIEFYTGIDRRRCDAVVKLTKDLKEMNADFLTRTGIPSTFNPYQDALWTPNDDSLQIMHQMVADCAAESALPARVKDRIADKTYDRSRPYNQEVGKFISESSLRQMVFAMMGAARALRNSDHVGPEAKTQLLEEVIICWVRVCQVAALLSPILATKGTAAFDGLGFYLGKSFDSMDDPEVRWRTVMTVIVDNVVGHFKEDLFSKKMGALLSSYINSNQGTLNELLVLLVMITQRPPGWEKEIESFIVRSKKNSFYLNRAFFNLLAEYKTSFSTERTRQQLRRLAGMAVAKHDTGAKHPNTKLVEKAAKLVVDKNDKAAPKQELSS